MIQLECETSRHIFIYLFTHNLDRELGIDLSDVRDLDSHVRIVDGLWLAFDLLLGRNAWCHALGASGHPALA
jgi:hypothetical protein